MVIRFPKAVQARLKGARVVPLTVAVAAASRGEPAEHTQKLALRR